MDSFSQFAMTIIVTRVIRNPIPTITLALVAVGLVTAAAAGEVPASPLFGMGPAYASVQSYTARFVRQEVVNGSLRPREEALLKFQRPGLIYLRWVAGPPW